MIVWGGADPNFLNTGGRYTPGTDSWLATSTTNAPAARESHTAVWTGSEMIVWGGVVLPLFQHRRQIQPWHGWLDGHEHLRRTIRAICSHSGLDRQ